MNNNIYIYIFIIVIFIMKTSKNQLIDNNYFKFNINSNYLKKNPYFRITFQYKIKKNSKNVTFGYVIKLNQNIPDNYTFDIMYKSDYYNIDCFLKLDLLESHIEQYNNDIKILENYIYNFSSDWYIDINNIIDNSFCTSKSIYTNRKIN